MAHDREVGGIHCHEVLELLSDFLDGDLDDATRAKIVSHLDDCDWCEQFGADVGALVQRIRTGDVVDPIDPAAVERLMERLGRR